jgi:NADH-quinone oxidoreductase subunit L
MVIGSITALFMGFLGLVQTDIKRVIAYSTLSQLGYMTVALGASAYPIAIFHLMTHAFFKALLFLAAGSVILGMHHDQDIRNMGGLYKYMKVTWITFLIGSLALIGTPGFAGFYSKDSIIDAVSASQLWGSDFAYGALLVGIFITALYSFRLYFLVFHGKERFDTSAHHDEGTTEHGHDAHHHGGPPRESHLVVTLPLVLLAIFSVCAGWIIGPFLYEDFFNGSIFIAERHCRSGSPPPGCSLPGISISSIRICQERSPGALPGSTGSSRTSTTSTGSTRWSSCAGQES